jgi:hypothetical protein
MAGVIPYLATSLETVYLSYEINRAAALGDGLIFSGQSAELMLHMLEPIQVGWGAVVSAHHLNIRSLYELRFFDISPLITILGSLLDPLLPRRHPLGS